MSAIPRMLPDDVVAARTGDAAAFSRLVRAHAGAVCAIATAILGSPSAGEEVGQEVFVHAWQDLPKLRDPARFGPWLRQIARNRANDALRRRIRRRELGDGRALEQLHAPNAETGELLDEARRERALWTAFEALEAEDREVLALFYRQGGSMREVSEQLELSEPAARKRLSRARARLRGDVLVALGQQLERTVPGVAFAAAVVALLGPRIARAGASPRRRAVPGWVATCAIGCILALAWRCAPDEGLSEGPRPSETRTARSFAAQIPVAPRPTAPSATDGQADVRSRVSVSVRLGTWEPVSGAIYTSASFFPGTFWPALDEAPFPEDEAVAAVVEHVEEGTPVTDELLAQTRALRTAALPPDPWAALVALEVERLHAERGWELARADFAERWALPDPGEVGWAAYEAARTRVDEPDPRLDLSAMLALSREARDTWPEHPVADYAELYVLSALGSPMSDTWSPEALGEEAMAVLRSSGDPLVLDAAVTQLANAGQWARLGPDDLDLLGDVYDDDEAEIPRFALALAGLESSLRNDDTARAAAWMTRHHATIEEECVGSLDRGQADWCGASRDARDNRSSWIAAAGGLAPVTWRAALMAIVRRCEADGHVLPARLVGEGRFDDGWTWSSWEGDADFAGCIASTPHEGPLPPEETQVRLEILPSEAP